MFKLKLTSNLDFTKGCNSEAFPCDLGDGSKARAAIAFAWFTGAQPEQAICLHPAAVILHEQNASSIRKRVVRWAQL